MDTRTGEIFRRDDAGNLLTEDYRDEHEHMLALERMNDAQARGELVGVSARVAQLVEGTLRPRVRG